MSSPPPIQILYISTLSVLAAAIIITNMLAFLGIVRSRRLHNPNNVFVAGMALADAAVGLVSVPLRIVSSLQLTFEFDTCLAINSTSFLFIDMSVFMLLGMTFDRLVAIRFTYLYHHFECKHAIVCTCVLWSCGILLMEIPVMAEDGLRAKYDMTCRLEAVISPAYLYYVRFWGFFVVPVVVIICTHVYTLTVVRRHKEDIRRHTVCPQAKRKCSMETKAEKMTIIMIAAFIVCFLPLNINDVMWYHNGHDIMKDHRIGVLKILYISNSLLDPLIYFYNNTRLRSSVRRMTTHASLRMKRLPTTATHTEQQSETDFELTDHENGTDEETETPQREQRNANNLQYNIHSGSNLQYLIHSGSMILVSGQSATITEEHSSDSNSDK